MNKLLYFLCSLALSGVTIAADQNDIIYRTEAGTGGVSSGTILELTAEGSPESGDMVLCHSSAGLRKCDIGDLPYAYPEVRGIVPSWTDIDTVAWSAGSAYVEGVELTCSAANSGNLGQSDAGLSATGVWHHYISDSSGCAFELSQTAPVYDSTYDYWRKGASASSRWIGYHITWTDTIRKVGFFTAQSEGRRLVSEGPVYDATHRRLQNGLASTANTLQATTNAITICAPGNADKVLLAMKIQSDSTSGGSQLVARISPRDYDGTENEVSDTAITYRGHSGAATAYSFLPPTWLQLTGPSGIVYHGYDDLTGGANNMLVDCLGSSQER